MQPDETPTVTRPGGGKNLKIELASESGIDGDRETVIFSGMDLVVIGYLATHGANVGRDAGCCMPGWGRDLRRGQVNTGGITLGTDKWVADKLMRPINGINTDGVQLVRHINALNGGTDQEIYWFPRRAFVDVSLIIEGIRVR